MKNPALKRLLKYLSPFKKSIALCFLLSLISVALTLAGPILIGKAIDEIDTGGAGFTQLFSLVIGLFLTFGISAASAKLLGSVTNKISYRAVKNIRSDAFAAIVAAPSSFSDTENHGTVISKLVNDVDIISEGLIQGAVQLFNGVVTAVATLAVMFVVNAVIALVVLLLTPLSLLAAAITTKNAYKHMINQAKLQGQLYADVSETVNGIRTIKAFGAGQSRYQKFREINENLNSVGFRAQYAAAITNPTTRFVNSIVVAAVCLLGAYFSIKSGGIFTVGTLSIFLNYANQYTKPFNEVSAVITQMSAALTSAERVFTVTDTERELNGGDKIISRSTGDFEIKDLSFSYDEDKPLIENLNLSVKSGDKIAIVGPTGSGKTTLINLLMRFYSPQSGKILLGGADIENIELESYRKLFGMVLQDTVIFSDTVYNNIAYGRQGASEKEIITAAKAAYADYFISNLKDGYRTVLDDSVNISAGERQLLCIARIMLADPQILILDEATSNVDILTEKYLQQGFKKMIKGRTSFIVAHRLSTITDADTIIVMDKGKIVQLGNHESLMRDKGFYYELFTGNFS